MSRVNDVRRKSQSELAWKTAQEASEVFNHDRVFTGASSNASIQLRNGANLSINPNSLVVISLNEESRATDQVSLELGSFLSRMARGQSYLLKIKDKSLKIESREDTELKIDTKGNRAQIQVVTGSIDIKADEQAPAKTVTVNEVASVSTSSGGLGVVIEEARTPASEPEVTVQEPIVVQDIQPLPQALAPPVREPPPRETIPAPPKPATAPKPSLLPKVPEVAPESPKAPPLLLQPPPPTATQPGLGVEAWFWLGSGMNYQYSEQSVPDLGDAKFQNVTGPTWLFRAGFQADSLGLDISYKDTPGKMNSSETVTIADGDYNWKTISGDVLFKPEKESKWTYRLGLQHHVMPFMARDPFDTVITIQSNTLTLLTLGFDRLFSVSEKLRVEWLMHYQYPILAGATNGTDFSVSPKLTFDGSVGGVISTGQHSRLGIYWYGQWHQYRFNYGGTSSFSGDQTLFYSNVELRFGLEY